MKKVAVEESIGQVLCHDITRIIRGVEKGAAFKKGHIIAAEDVEELKNMGKYHIFVWEKDEKMLHENEAAEILRDLSINEHMQSTEPSEGKIELLAVTDGLFKVDKTKLAAVNGLGELVIASRQGNFPVKKGDKLAAMRVIPLVIEKDKMQQAAALKQEQPIFSLLPFKKKKVAVICVGSEIFFGRIKDTFTEVLLDKLQEYHAEIMATVFSPDDPSATAQLIKDFLAQGAEMVVCAGGMSVDPDDLTPLAIRESGAEVVVYGVPVLPGAMCLLSYYDGKIPVIGLPGCVMYCKRTSFDLILPRLMADDPVTKEDLTALGEGGLCLSCPVCTFPQCGFGK